MSYHLGNDWTAEAETPAPAMINPTVDPTTGTKPTAPAAPAAPSAPAATKFGWLPLLLIGGALWLGLRK